MRDTLVDICFRSGILAGKEVNIGLGGGRHKPLRPADMLIYSWGRSLDCVWDLTQVFSPLTQTGRLIFTSSCDGRCGTSELEKDAVTLLKRI
ncbi:hypothetical protein Tco_1125073 [Tanacetum coccineum]|uniref:Uncharacterized protein n=1 Tax=Tanacetum coccineum TaxID=301880 RepID=A0ABQ5JAY6_9ASTR